MVKAVFLDRDGVINELVDGHAPWCYNDFKMLPFVTHACRILRDCGYTLFVVTNQPDVLYGNHLEQSELDRMMADVVLNLGVRDWQAALVRDTPQYKPENGMVEYLISKHRVDRRKSFMVGDRWKDIVCARKSLIQPIFITDSSALADYQDIIAEDLLDAVNYIRKVNND